MIIGWIRSSWYSLAPSMTRAGPISVAIIVSVGPVLIIRLSGATVSSQTLIVCVVSVLGRSWGSTAPSTSRASSLSITLVVVGASISKRRLIKGVPGILSLVVSELEGTGEHHRHGKDQQKLDAHWERYVKIISLTSVIQFIIHLQRLEWSLCRERSARLILTRRQGLSSRTTRRQNLSSRTCTSRRATMRERPEEEGQGGVIVY